MDWLEPEVTTPAAGSPVSLEIIKQHLQEDAPDNDVLIQSYIAAAVDHIEAMCGPLATQTVKLRADGLFSPEFLLPIAPVQSIASITYQDASGVTQTVPSDVYVASLYGLSPRVSLAVGKSWPAHRVATGSVTITAVVGYQVVPSAIEQAIKLMVGDMYEHRETVVAGVSASHVPSAATVENLLARYRRRLIP